MFGFLRRKPVNPPTDKQLRYAKRLGIAVTSNMGRQEVSAAIAAAERANPELAARRETVTRKARERRFGPELIQQEQQWNRFADTTEFMLAIYQRGKETIVDVLRVNGASVNDRGKLILDVQAPKVTRDRYIGAYLEWDHEFELSVEKLRRYEPLTADFYMEGNDAYRRAVERGLKIARKL
jgi:hypothetical protein